MKKIAPVMVLIVAIVIVGLLIVRQTRILRSLTESTSKPQTFEFQKENEEKAPPVVTRTNAIFVVRQNPGPRIIIQSVIADKPGFVVIHGANPDGTAGEAFGSTAVEAKNYLNLVVSLTKQPESGTDLVAVLHVDNGDGEYSEGDPPAVDSDGKPAQMTFLYGPQPTINPE